MPEQLRIGMIGTSRWADISHLPCLKSHSRARLNAICGRNRDRAEEMAAKYQIPHVFTDYREMIEKGDLQAVVVSAPDDLHYPMTMEALDAGLHVLCEKPLAVNTRQAEEMWEKAEAKGLKHMIYFTNRWVPHYRYLKKLIDEGYIGRPFHCHFHYFAGYGRKPSPSRWRFDRQRGIGILGDLGSHLVDLARWYIGDIARVSGSLATFVEQSDDESQFLDSANNSALLAIEFVNETHGVLHASAAAVVGDAGQTRRVILQGESGTLEADYSFKGDTIRGIRYGENEPKLLPVPDDFFGDIDRNQPLLSQLGEIFTTQSVGDRQFIDAILEDQPASPNFYDGLQVQKVLDAAIVSHAKGTRIELQ
jgi:predicted dehydrogenase